MRKHIAQVGTPIGNKFEGIGNIGLEGGTGDPVTGLAGMISTVIGILTLVAAVYFLFILITGAISIMSAGGDKGAYEAARKKLGVGVIGLAVAIIAIFLADLVAWLLGVEGLLNLGEMINKISP